MGRHRFDDDKDGQWGGPALAERDAARQGPHRHDAAHAPVNGDGDGDGDEGVPPPR
ncbi:hypothetical protein ORV05_03580 [Amycolatopsis cynarae]|uniref:Uncharacterized protein n=1 Tax=Amycolatopsis cynarae TaxID=2995223 RepID=A0ABY7B3J9_9PSEU|nr:hypothetical protein [Amycolatopsis sp. HUAS 11-8]WAL66896.1 hypothetical protein ORV05_03580 [Amycolatopsis sp. HUAS 11-8]